MIGRSLTPEGEHELSMVRFDSPEFKARLLETLARIDVVMRKSLKPYVAFSGGKDSLVVGYLVEAVASRSVTMAWSDDELEYPETVELMSVLAGDPSFVITAGTSVHANWFQPWTDRPYWREPFLGTHTIAINQDDWMARRGYDLTFLGTRADESRKRRDWLHYAALKYGPSYPVRSGTRHRCCPIWDWSTSDVWALITGWRIPVNPVYTRMREAGIEPHRQRVGPLPLVPRSTLEVGWPETLDRLEQRYGKRWS